MLWIAVHLPQLSMESFAATLDAATRQRPLALIEAHRITHVDARAAVLGVQPGARRSTALALAADLVLGQADAARDAQALQAVGYAALAFTPMVCMDATDDAGTPAHWTGPPGQPRHRTGTGRPTSRGTAARSRPRPRRAQSGGADSASPVGDDPRELTGHYGGT